MKKDSLTIDDIRRAMRELDLPNSYYKFLQMLNRGEIIFVKGKAKRRETKAPDNSRIDKA